MTETILSNFTHQVRQQWLLEGCVSEMMDVLRCRACLRHGFPTLNQASTNNDTRWTVNGKYYGATPTEAVDAILRTEVAANESCADAADPTNTLTQLARKVSR